MNTQRKFVTTCNIQSQVSVYKVKSKDVESADVCYQGMDKLVIMPLAITLTAILFRHWMLKE